MTITEKRKHNSCSLKSIWDESLIQEILPNSRHRNKMWNWLINHPDKMINEIPFVEWQFPRDAIKSLKEDFVKYTSTVITQNESKKEDTIKLLIKLHDGFEIETVVIKHKSHTTVCVSSQIGCKMGCKFCATGTMGMIGNLSSFEILEQIAHANTISTIRNVVFMGMGEPLSNYENVKNSVLFLIDNQKYALSPKHVTVSTVGVVKYMYQLSEDLPQINLALSLHAPNQIVRLKIVPSASAHNIDKLMAAIDNHIKLNSDVIPSHRLRSTAKHNKEIKLKNLKSNGVMIEYILIHDINDLEEHAHELGKLLSSRREYILLNLIPYNPTSVSEDFSPPTAEAVQKFSEICRSEPYNIHTRVRQEMGQDIAGACGQLALVNKPKNENTISFEIEDFPLSSYKNDSNNRSRQPNNEIINFYRKTALTLLLPSLAIILFTYRKYLITK